MDEGQSLLVTGRLRCVPEAEHDDEIDRRHHHDEPEHRQDLDEPAARRAVPASCSRRPGDPSGTSTVAAAATAPSGPGQPTRRCSTVATSATVAARRHSDPEPLHAVRGGSRWTRCSATRSGAIASTPAMAQLMAPSTTVKGWWLTTEPDPDAERGDVGDRPPSCAGTSRAADRRASARRKWNEIAVTTTAAMVATSRAPAERVHRLRLAARRERDHRHEARPRPR